jgi:drug/metabolite transporter (DMT)-like permease
MRKNPMVLAWIMLLGLSLVWGSSFILIKKGLIVFSSLEVGALRIALAAIVLMPISITRFHRIKKKHLLLLLTIGLVGSLLPSFFFAIAQTRLSSGLAGAFNALTPLFVLLMGVFFFKQKMQPEKLLGMGIALIGTLILILSGKGGFLEDINYYAILVVIATIFYGLNLNIIKYYLADLKALTITSVSLLIVSPIALVVLFGFTPFVDNMQHAEGAWRAFGFICILGVVGTALALIVFNNLVQMTNPLFTSSVTYIIPLVAVIWGLIDGENLYTMQYIAMVGILMGVYLINKKRG